MIPKKIEYRLFILLILCFTTNAALAQLSKQNLIGKYAMNHDGWEGTLVIEQIKQDCNSSPWCDLNIYYIDSDNKTHRARIRNISKDWQHITFIIRFSDHLQLFQGHFFSRDKNVMAGTTTWRKDFASGKEGFTMAALLLFGQPETIGSALPHSKVDALLRVRDKERYDDRVNIRCNLVEAYDLLMQFVA